jgi:hypothetical protein
LTVAPHDWAVATAPAGQNTPNNIDIVRAPYYADRTGKLGCAAAVQAAIDLVQKNGSGSLYFPQGQYQLDAPVVGYGNSLSFLGDGEALSILKVTHNSTAFGITCTYPTDSISFEDLGMSPCPIDGGTAGVALELSYPSGAAAWQRCIIDTVDFGVALPGYTAFLGAITAKNCWRGNFRNINLHGENLIGGFFARMAGLSIDNRFIDVNVDGFNDGVLVAGYSEGLYLTRCVLITNSGLSTGTSGYLSDKGTTGVNLLQLRIDNSEFNCTSSALSMYQVTQALISNTHFGVQYDRSPAIRLLGSNNNQFSTCHVTGQFGAPDFGHFVGIEVGGIPFGQGQLNGSNNNQFDSMSFAGVQAAIVLSPGAVGTTGTGGRMNAYGTGSLQSGIIDVEGFPTRPVVDRSGNSTNHTQWFGPAGLVGIN